MQVLLVEVNQTETLTEVHRLNKKTETEDRRVRLIEVEIVSQSSEETHRHNAVEAIPGQRLQRR